MTLVNGPITESLLGLSEGMAVTRSERSWGSYMRSAVRFKDGRWGSKEWAEFRQWASRKQVSLSLISLLILGVGTSERDIYNLIK